MTKEELKEDFIEIIENSDNSINDLLDYFINSLSKSYDNGYSKGYEIGFEKGFLDTFSKCLGGGKWLNTMKY